MFIVFRHKNYLLHIQAHNSAFDGIANRYLKPHFKHLFCLFLLSLFSYSVLPSVCSNVESTQWIHYTAETQKIDEKLRLLFLPLTRYTLRIVEGYWCFYIILTQCGGRCLSTAGFSSEEFKDCESNIQEPTLNVSVLDSTPMYSKSLLPIFWHILLDYLEILKLGETSSYETWVS